MIITMRNLYSELISFLFDINELKVKLEEKEIETILENIIKIIGYFNLDSYRVLDIAIEVFKYHLIKPQIICAIFKKLLPKRSFFKKIKTKKIKTLLKIMIIFQKIKIIK